MTENFSASSFLSVQLANIETCHEHAARHGITQDQADVCDGRQFPHWPSDPDSALVDACPWCPLLDAEQ